MNVPKIKLYRYLSARYAISAIEGRELRVGRIAELNDPFEFVVALKSVRPDLPHDEVDRALMFVLDYWKDFLGIISFASQQSDPVIWSHYADSHRGIALGFEVEQDDSLLKMTYPSVRPSIDPGPLSEASTEELVDLVKSILSAKAPSWGYEDEYRISYRTAEMSRQRRQLLLPDSRRTSQGSAARIQMRCLKEIY